MCMELLSWTWFKPHCTVLLGRPYLLLTKFYLWFILWPRRKRVPCAIFWRLNVCHLFPCVSWSFIPSQGWDTCYSQQKPRSVEKLDGLLA
jgi:hypothetical protein